MEMRVAKFLAHAGLGARRVMEEWIKAGRVKVNGVLIQEVGTKIDSTKDRIEVDGKQVTLEENFQYIIVNKPTGYLCTTEDTHGRKTVLDLMSSEESLASTKLIIVGRLDKESEGLLLLTNNGELAHKLMHPSFEKEKEYLVYFKGRLEESEIEQLKKGVPIPLDDGSTYMTRPIQISHVKYEEKNKRTVAQLLLKEGKKRQIRLMGEAVGHRVSYLKRIRIGNIQLEDLPLGKWRHLSEHELQLLLSTTS